MALKIRMRYDALHSPDYCGVVLAFEDNGAGIGQTNVRYLFEIELAVIEQYRAVKALVVSLLVGRDLVSAVKLEPSHVEIDLIEGAAMADVQRLLTEADLANDFMLDYIYSINAVI